MNPSLPDFGDMERAILGSILLDNEKLFDLGSLTADHLALDSHRRILRVMFSIMASGDTVDFVTLMAELERRKELKKVGGPAYLSTLTDGLYRGMNIERYCDQIIDLDRRKRFIHQCEASIAMAYDGSELTQDCITVTHEKLLELGSEAQTGGLVKISEFAPHAYHQLKQIADAPNKLIGFHTGIPQLDELTTGWRKKEYYVIGGWAKGGKTSFVLQTLRENLYRGVKCGMFSQEMTKEQVLQRMIPPLTGGRVTASMLRKGTMNHVQRKVFEETEEVIAQWPLWVDDTGSLDARELVSRARYGIRKHGIELLVVDYLQLMKVKGADSRVMEVTYSSAALRELAKAENVALIVVSQLGRPDGKMIRRPVMFDLRDSGTIEQDAHAVIFGFIPEKDGRRLNDEAELVIAAQREGPTAVIQAEYNPNTLSWEPRGGFKDGEYQNDTLWQETAQ